MDWFCHKVRIPDTKYFQTFTEQKICSIVVIRKRITNILIEITIMNFIMKFQHCYIVKVRLLSRNSFFKHNILYLGASGREWPLVLNIIVIRSTKYHEHARFSRLCVHIIVIISHHSLNESEFIISIDLYLLPKLVISVVWTSKFGFAFFFVQTQLYIQESMVTNNDVWFFIESIENRYDWICFRF